MRLDPGLALSRALIIGGLLLAFYPSMSIRMKSKKKISDTVTVVDFITLFFYGALLLSVLWALSLVF
jgi:hypothetical protein